MGKAHDFILYLQERVAEIAAALKLILKEEELLKENILIGSGFIIRRYQLKVKIKPEQIIALVQVLKKTKSIEQEILYQMKNVEANLNLLEKDYNAINQTTLHLSLVFKEKMNNAFYLASIAQGRIIQLQEALQKERGGKVKNLLESLQKIFNQILQFTDLVDQLARKMQYFEENYYLEIPRTYGRAVSKREEKSLIASQELIGSPKREKDELIAVFDAPPNVRSFINSLSASAVRNYFSRLGAAGAVKIIYFQTKLKPVNYGTPIPSRVTIGGGAFAVKEYKFPKGISIQITH